MRTLFFLSMLLAFNTTAFAGPGVGGAPPAVPAGSPDKLLVFAPDLTVYEWQAGGNTALALHRTAAAKENGRRAVLAYLDHDGSFTALKMPPLPPDAQKNLDAHLALLKLVMADSLYGYQSGGDAWKNRAASLDYTIGDGLRALATRTGADKALLLTGADVQQTAGHAVMGVLLGALTGQYESATVYVNAAIIDLHSGKLVYERRQTFSGKLQDPKTLAKLVKELLGPYPQSNAMYSGS